MKLVLGAEHTRYFTRDEKPRRLTGVTTYLGVLDKPALRGWYAAEEAAGVLAVAEKYGLHGTEPLSQYLPKKKDGKRLWFAEAKRDKAADLGTVTHARCAGWITNDPLEPTGIPRELFEQSIHGFDRFRSWFEESKFEVLRVEQVVIYDDGKMAYGGTADYLLRDPEKRNVLLDLKTSKFSLGWPYDELFGQTAAYAEGSANDPRVALDIDRIIGLRIGKEPGDISKPYELKPEERKHGWDLFRAAYAASEAKRALEKLRK